MNIIVTGFFLFFLLLFPQKILAVSSHVIVSPSDGSTTSDTSPKLSWTFSDQCYASGSCFRVQVATSSSFASMTKDTYTDSTSYSPRLSLGNWFWRVKGRDTSGSWGEWSSSSFIIVSSPSPTPTPSPTPAPSESSTPTPSQDIAPTDSPLETSVPDLVDESSAPVFSPIATSITMELSNASDSSDSGKKIATASSKNKQFQTPKVEVLGTSENILPKIFIALGSILIISSGVIFLVTYKRKNG